MSTNHEDLESQTPLRLEEGWTDGNEGLVFDKWKTKFEELAEAHGKKGQTHKKWHTRIGLPKLIIPFLMTGASAIGSEWEYMYILNAVGFAATGILTAYYDFYGFAQQKEKNDQHSASYSDMISTIDVAQARGKDFREPADRFVEKIQARYDNLTRTSPDL